MSFAVVEGSDAKQKIAVPLKKHQAVPALARVLSAFIGG
jgi:hypothetical protein